MTQLEIVQCTECERWFEKEISNVFSIPLFRYPKHWFFLWWRWDSTRVDAQFCSWFCTKDFVDRMATKERLADQDEKAQKSRYVPSGAGEEESQPASGC
jgi:hypothetical protein